LYSRNKKQRAIFFAQQGQENTVNLYGKEERGTGYGIFKKLQKVAGIDRENDYFKHGTAEEALTG
jgi:hypothetical protein